MTKNNKCSKGILVFLVVFGILEFGDLDKINDTWSNWVTISNPINTYVN